MLVIQLLNFNTFNKLKYYIIEYTYLLCTMYYYFYVEFYSCRQKPGLNHKNKPKTNNAPTGALN